MKPYKETELILPPVKHTSIVKEQLKEYKQNIYIKNILNLNNNNKVSITVQELNNIIDEAFIIGSITQHTIEHNNIKQLSQQYRNN